MTAAARLTFAVAIAEVLALLPLASFAALVPLFLAEWQLSNAEAGWINGIYYFGYMLAVPFLMALTDRVDARLVLVGGCLVSAAAQFGFALQAEGFWSALWWRALAGAGLAGVYMPGLRALTDRLGPIDQSRSVTFYTASYSVGVGTSFLVTGFGTELGGWPLGFVLCGIGPVLGLALALIVLPPHRPAGAADWRSFLDFRPVVRNRAAFGYILAYAAHGYELMAMRGWITAFLVYVSASRPDEMAVVGATTIAAILTFIGLPSSIAGNELALRFGRRRVIAAIMMASLLVALALGFSSGLPLWAVLALALLYGVTITADSGSITSGTVGAAEPGRQGATMAVHSTFGFGASFLGPLVVGVALDLAGGPDSAGGWLAAFLAMGLGGALGVLALARLRR